MIMNLIKLFFYFIVLACIYKVILLVATLVQYLGVWVSLIGFFVILFVVAWLAGWVSEKLGTGFSMSSESYYTPTDHRTPRQRLHDEYHAAKLNARTHVETQSEYADRKRLQQAVRDSY